MTKLCNLKAGRVESAPEWRELRGVLASVLHVSTPTKEGEEAKALTHVTLGSAGLQIFRGEVRVGIEIDELIRLAAAHEPLLGGVSGSTRRKGKA